MKTWQVEAIRKIDEAARSAKKTILGMGPTAKYDSSHGVMKVNLVENHDGGYTLTRRMQYPF